MSEDAHREQERNEVAALVSAAGSTVSGSNPSGMYELCGECSATALEVDPSYGYPQGAEC
jgi:hypothetical protein